ncbi:hypothetical protein [Ramlibacter sp. AN1133]|uniref:hypothetical protein n=1 Tax=Ramlibacter sp. AN1133 TaxID=3133429 RepID=UPI0030BBEFBE
MRTTLAALVEDCAGDERSCCPILERLSAPASTPVVTDRSPGRTLKQVKPGSSVAQRRRPIRVRASQQATGSHSGLVAWSRSFAAAA